MKANVKSIAWSIAVFATATAMTGCADASPEAVGPDPERVEICLKGSVSGGLSIEAAASPDSRADAVPGVLSAKHEELPLSFARSDADPVTHTGGPSFSTISETIPATLAASADGSATDITFTPKQYYLVTDDEIYSHTIIHGWYPPVSDDTNNTVTFANGVVTVPVNGWNDFLWSGKESGSKNQPFGVIQFKHLFTQIKIEAYAENEGAKNAWGKIKTIKLKQQPKTYSFALHTGSESDGPLADLELVRKSALDNTDLPAEIELGVATVSESDASSITTHAVPCGYAMIPPIERGQKLSLEVVMANGEKRTLEAAWAGNATNYYSYEAGKAYTITLKFTAAEIGLTATVNNWTNFNWQEDGDGSFDGVIAL